MRNGRRIMAMLLVVTLVFSMVPAAAAEGFAKTQTWMKNQFSDVADEHWFYENVKSAYELGLMSGDPDGSFRPDGQVTLAETVTVASRIHAIYTLGEENFVQGDIWYQVYVDYALQNGILQKALPAYNRAATRLEFADILSRALPKTELSQINTVEDGAIPDVKDDEAVYLLYRAGILTGNDEMGTFAPESSIKRSEVAAIVTRMALPELRKSITLTKDSQDNSTSAVKPEKPDEVPEETPDEAPEDTKEEEIDLTVGTVPFDVANPEQMESDDVRYSGETLLIKLETAVSGVPEDLQAAGVTSLELIMDTGLGVWYTATVAGAVEDAMAAVRKCGRVLLAEYNYMYETEVIGAMGSVAADVHGNTDYARQWYLDSCGIQYGWEELRHHHGHHGGSGDGSGESTPEEVLTAGKGVVVAVIDTGVDYNHTDLKDNMWVNEGEIPDNNIDDDGNGYIDDYYGWNAVAGKGSAMDDNGHGTHVAGIIAADNNNMGTVGIAYDAKIMAIKAGMSSGYFNQADIAKAIVYAYRNGADVINMSFGGSTTNIAIEEALTAAFTQCVLVAAAGNDGKPNEFVPGWNDYEPCYPAAYSYVLGVMSIDPDGRESSFTNWDVEGFNSIEYEVYAPGYQLLSTIPNDQYATWSGTSMAAPVVSAMAALLRDRYSDQVMYPTRFIYGQLSSTGPKLTACTHSVIHNLPKIVDLHQAMTVLPTPELGVSEYMIFDTPGFALDSAGQNNGDGVIDAGETIAIGFEIRNRWGAAKDVTVSVDTLTQGGVTDPYVEILTPSVSYDAVGTYSTIDAGRVKDSAGLITGWEKPIYLRISQNCPDDYTIGLNIHVYCKNALDETDLSVYEFHVVDPPLPLNVRNGVILPNKIETDMTLSGDKLYIIPNSTTIFEGATVTVEPGAQIQFWSDDEQDAYGQQNIAYLKVEGRLLLNGTAEKPIEVYPSGSFSEYRTEIFETNGGQVKMYHTKVTNPYLDISYAEDCEFLQNHRSVGLYYRRLDSDGSVSTYYLSGQLYVGIAKDCVFYKLGGSNKIDLRSNRSDTADMFGYVDGCVFVDCALDYHGTYTNCVFLGNNNFLTEKTGQTSSMKLSAIPPLDFDSTENPVHLISNEANNAWYVLISTESSWIYDPDALPVQAFAETMGGHLVYFETEEELSFCKKNLPSGCGSLFVGAYYDPVSQITRWMSGEPVGDFLEIGSNVNGQGSFYWDGFSEICLQKTRPDGGSGITGYFALEFSEEVSLEEIAEKWAVYQKTGCSPFFKNNVVLNRTELLVDDVTRWLRLSGDKTGQHPISGNYWGTTSEELIGHQILDYDDYQSLVDLHEGNYLTTPPENVWPFVVEAGVKNKDGEKVTVVGAEELTFYVTFNRDMDTTIPLDVRFGSAYPYADYQVDGAWVDDRTWEGKMTLNTLIAGGYQFFYVENGRAADDHDKELYRDWGRFPFKIDTTTAMSMNLQGEATAEGIELTWYQDDFDTLAGYNVYRAESEDGLYQKLNSTIIPVGTNTWFDADVLPGTEYFYTFTVVKTDFAESQPAGKISIESWDTMSPTIYHSPVGSVKENRNLVIDVEVTDNMTNLTVLLHYRVKGAESWEEPKQMTLLSGKYSAVISADRVTTAGVEYYITAFDGTNTTLKGSAENPYQVTVTAVLGDNAKGDVNGDGKISILDALMILKAVNDETIITDTAVFARADLNGDGKLTAAEALVVLKYANGEIGSLDML